MLETVQPGFEVRSEGIYYTPGRVKIGHRARSSTPLGGKSRELAKFEGSIGNGLGVSPDGKRILFSREDSSADLMLVDNFR